MTMPHLMNCPHRGAGHCIDCVKEEWERQEELKANLQAQIATQEAIVVATEEKAEKLRQELVSEKKQHDNQRDATKEWHDSTELYRDKLKALEKKHRACPWVDGTEILQGEHEADIGSIGVVNQLYIDLRKQLEEMTRERDAYRKAKQENDERFMNERDAAREEVVKLKAELEIAQTNVDLGGAELAWATSDYHKLKAKLEIITSAIKPAVELLESKGFGHSERLKEAIKTDPSKWLTTFAGQAWDAGYTRGLDEGYGDGDEELHPTKEEFLASLTKERPHSVGVVTLLLVGTKVWLAERVAPDRAYQGMLAAPGGSVEPGEEFPNAAQREVAEETGLDIAQSRFNYGGRTEHTYGDGKPFSMHWFHVQLDPHEIPLSIEPHKQGTWSLHDIHPGLQQLATPGTWEALNNL